MEIYDAVPGEDFWSFSAGVSLPVFGTVKQSRTLAEKNAAVSAAEANAADPILARIEHRHRVETLIAKGGKGEYSFDVHLQGPQETVFFDV